MSGKKGGVMPKQVVEEVTAEPTEKKIPGLLEIMAQEQHMSQADYSLTVRTSCFDKECTREQFMAFLMIANEHKLNPITREIYAFEKQGKITPIVSIDGWLKIINSHPDFLGMEFEDNLDSEGNIVSITCKMYRLRNGNPVDRPTSVTEYLEECHRDTIPWKKWPIRMLRHKTTIQCARYAFGFAGIYDVDEGERIRDGKIIEGSATVVQDAPETTAKGILSKLQHKVTEEDLAPETVSHETTTKEPHTDPVPEPRGPLGDNDPVIPADEETGEIKLEDIPGLTKGGKPVSPENQDFVDAMEKD